MKPNFLGISPLLFGIACAVLFSSGHILAQTPYQSSADFAKYAMKLRESAILRMEPRVVIPTDSRTLSVSGRYPWKTGIITTTFWVGEQASQNNPVHNHSSSWDLNWAQNFGGFDNPDVSARRNFIPANFVPRLNPFYVALPYNDVTRGSTKPESKLVIPWFREAFEREGKTVCRDRWVAVRNSNGKVCYAQWSDCGPFRTDHWQYVFGNEKPKPNLNGGAGLDISPAVRDYLGLKGTDVTDWKFVEFKDIQAQRGPWSQYGENNDFIIKARNTQEHVVSAAPLPNRPAPAPQDSPTIVTKPPQ